MNELRTTNGSRWLGSAGHKLIVAAVAVSGFAAVLVARGYRPVKTGWVAYPSNDVGTACDGDGAGLSENTGERRDCISSSRWTLSRVGYGGRSRKVSRPRVQIKTVDYLRDVVTRWAEAAGDATQIFVACERGDDVRCVIDFNDRPSLDVELLHASGAERFGIEAALFDSLSQIRGSGADIWISSLAEQVAWSESPYENTKAEDGQPALPTIRQIRAAPTPRKSS